MNKSDQELKEFLVNLNINELRSIESILPIYYDRMIISIPKEVLRKPNLRNAKDTYYDMIEWYNYYKHQIEHGTGFTPIFYKIEKLKQAYPKTAVLHFIERRTAYIKLLEEELKYLRDRFNWTKIENVDEIFISVFENIVELISELFLLTVQLYIKKKQGVKRKKVNDFLGLIKFFEKETDLPEYFHNSYDFFLNYSAYRFIRNKMVHEPTKIKFRMNLKIPRLLIEIDHDYRYPYDVFDKYIHYLIKKYPGKKRKNSTVNIRSKDFKFIIQLSNNSKPILDESEIYFEKQIIPFVKKMKLDLFQMQKVLFGILIKELN